MFFRLKFNHAEILNNQINGKTRRLMFELDDTILIRKYPEFAKNITVHGTSGDLLNSFNELGFSDICNKQICELKLI